jgi:extracellular factor (EF) 3-hydroxypalmitic acid methyl ester biosynthesis protein
MNKQTPNPKDEFLSTVKTAKSGLEFLTANDWILFYDRAKDMHFRNGDRLLHQGKQTKLVHVVTKGTVRIEAGARRVATLRPGQVCGEMAFLENGVASANAIAEGDVSTRSIEWSELSDLFQMFPHVASRFYQSLAVSLSQRLREQIVPM